MKVCVIGVDGAEFSLINKHTELRNFRQIEYGFHSIPHLSTSVLWPCFLTGTDPEDFWLPLWKRAINHFSRKIVGRQMFADDESWKSHTMLNLTPSSVGIEIPRYTDGKVCANRISISLETYDPDTLEELVLSEFQNTFDQVMDALKEDRELIVVHFGVLDLYQHFYDVYGERMFQAYRLVDKTISKILDEFSGVTFVVSDHGLIKGLHTPYGFYSVNRKLSLREKIPDLSFTSYYGIIEKLLNNETIERKRIPYEIREWKLLKTLQIMRQVKKKPLALLLNSSLESKVLHDILERYGFDYVVSPEEQRSALNVTTRKWCNGGEDYMAYHFQRNEVNPILHWANEDVVRYALSHGIPLPSDYPVSEEITKETILDRMEKLGYIDDHTQGRC